MIHEKNMNRKISWHCPFNIRCSFAASLKKNFTDLSAFDRGWMRPQDVKFSGPFSIVKNPAFSCKFMFTNNVTKYYGTYWFTPHFQGTCLSLSINSENMFKNSSVGYLKIGFNVDPEPAFYLIADPDPDPGSQTNAD